MEERIRELERQLGRKTLEVEILKGPQGPWPQCGRESLKDMDKTRSKKTDVARACCAPTEGRFAVKVVAKTLGVSRSNLHARLNESAKPHRRYKNAREGEGRQP